MGYSAIARVLTGWTGFIYVSADADATVYPRTRDSVCSLLARLVHDGLVLGGTRLVVSASSTGVLTIATASGATFDLAFDSGCATRTGFTSGPYSGASSYTADAAYSTAYVPARGLRVDGALLATTRGSVVGDGSGASSPRRVSTSTRLVLWDDQLQMPTWADYDWDVWHDGRWFGRFVVEAARRAPLGSLRTTDNITFEVDVREVGAGEVVQTAPDWSTLPDAAGWLLGYVRTDVPGYREIDVDGTPYTVASSTPSRFDDFFDDVNTAIGAHPTSLAWEDTGRIVGADALPANFADRLGWILGFGNTQPGTAISLDTTANFVPPAAIPLTGVTWEQVESDEDRRVVLDESLRNQGYAWGGALLWRCTLTMHRYAIEALQTGWCLNGRVCLTSVAKLSTPISNSDPAGYIDGYIVGDPQVTWQGKQQFTAVVQLTIASG